MKSLVFPVQPGHSLNLHKYDPRYNADISRKQGEEEFAELTSELNSLQELLYAASTHSMLIVLQGMDTSGKDGTIRNVLSQVSPLGCRVHSFKVPTDEELAHDFLWRVHRATPRKGEIVVFNRSHYEDVLIVRVHNLVSQDIWSKRYQQINDFERLLAENNTIILKFFLHISKEEQKKRLLAREEAIEKAWKLTPSDWHERHYWDDYQVAYEDALLQCTTDYAPWSIVPADRKWFRNLAIIRSIVKTLRSYKDTWTQQLEQMSKHALQELQTLEERQELS
jgi:PPK2 family polyphosphate:nucleotide phosphotransferase